MDHDTDESHRSDETRIEITSADATALVDVAAGGRVAQLTVAGIDLLIPPAWDEPESTGWGSFPMAPFAGRIRHGRFRFLGESHQLERNHQDHRDGIADSDCQHAIHGTVFQRRWSIDEAGDDHVTMWCPLVGRLGWPLAGTARQTVRIDDGALHVDLTVEADDGALPAEVGWHPWFVKPDRLEFSPRPPVAMYLRDPIGLPTGELIEPPPGPWDDCFVHRGAVLLHYEQEPAAVVTITSDCDHWVVFDEPSHATCVEPQSGPPDAYTIRPRVVIPDHPLRRRMTIAW